MTRAAAPSSVAAREIALARPAIGSEEEIGVLNCLRSGWLTTGRLTRQFEERMAALLGVPDTVAVSSGTAALWLSMRSLSLQKDDEVLLPALTWVSAANAVAALGLKPVFCDVDPGTLTLSLDDAARVLSPRTKAIMPMHFGGFMIDMEKVTAFADRHGLAVIEDAAHAIGAERNGVFAGACSDIGVFSFHPSKNLTTGEGGLVISRDRQRLAAIRRMRYLGIGSDPMARHQGGFLAYDSSAPELKFIMNDIAAAIGLAQLDKLGRHNRKRAEIAAGYGSRLAHLADRILLPEPSRDHPEAHVWHLYPVRLPDRPDYRDRVARKLKEAGIGTGLHYKPLTELAWVRAAGWNRPLLHADRIGRTILSLPMHPGLTDRDLDFVADALANALEDS